MSGSKATGRRTYATAERATKKMVTAVTAMGRRKQKPIRAHVCTCRENHFQVLKCTPPISSSASMEPLLSRAAQTYPKRHTLPGLCLLRPEREAQPDGHRLSDVRRREKRKQSPRWYREFQTSETHSFSA